jgi:hypothetical protein
MRTQMDALLTENARLQELVAVKDQLLLCKEEQLATKDQLLAAQGQLLVSKEREARTAEELQQHKDLDHQCSDSVKRQRLHDRSRLERASLLDKDEVLDQILSYVGGGEHLYVAGVSRRCRGRYLQH